MRLRYESAEVVEAMNDDGIHTQSRRFICLELTEGEADRLADAIRGRLELIAVEVENPACAWRTELAAAQPFWSNLLADIETKLDELRYGD